MPNAQMPQVIAVAKSQVGVHEGYAEGGWNNIQRYSTEVPGLAWSQGQSWCNTFLSWVALKAGVPQLFPVTAAVATAMSWFQSAGRFSWYPAVGAQVFLGNGGTDHTGIVFAFDQTYIWTVEGNTNINGSTEGDGVYIRQRKRSDAAVYAYGLPAYSEGIVTCDPALKGKAGYTYATSGGGPGPASLQPGGLMTDNFVAGTASVYGALTADTVSGSSATFTGTVTGSNVGTARIFSGPTAPTTPQVGDVWIKYG